MVILKFGGTSIRDAQAFAKVVNIIRRCIQEQTKASRPGTIVVVSAMSGVTNLLIDSAKQAAAGHECFKSAQGYLRDKHQQVAEQFIQDSNDHEALMRIFDEKVTEFRRLCSSIAILGELTDRGIDVVSGLGERLSAPLLATILRAQGISSEFVDAGEIIVTDNNNNGANPIMELTEMRCKERLLPMLENKIVPIITGFISTSINGTPTTLGRGGSDYSASIIGASLDVDEVQIWTDVNGILTADPKIVPDAQSINQLTYEEVSELAHYGAKVLHPKTVIPVIDKHIPLRVCNTYEPDYVGTYVVSHASYKSQKKGVKAVTYIQDVALITISGRGFMGIPGIAARTFASTARVTANVLMISQSSSEQTICFIVLEADANSVLQALQTEFEYELERKTIDQIVKQSDISVIAIVGSEMRGTPGIAANMFNAIGQHNINVIAIAQGSSEANISIVVANEDTNKAVLAIHSAFRLNELNKG